MFFIIFLYIYFTGILGIIDYQNLTKIKYRIACSKDFWNYALEFLAAVSMLRNKLNVRNLDRLLVWLTNSTNDFRSWDFLWITFFLSLYWEAAKNGYFLNGSAIKALPPPPPALELNSSRNFAVEKKVFKTKLFFP